jgi:hypothetical protein
MIAPNPLAARRRTNSSSFSVAVPSLWEESVVSGAITNRFAVSRPLLNLKGDQTTIDQTSVIPPSRSALPPTTDIGYRGYWITFQLVHEYTPNSRNIRPDFAAAIQLAS